LFEREQIVEMPKAAGGRRKEVVDFSESRSRRRIRGVE
jgi:hypothetical protein